MKASKKKERESAYQRAAEVLKEPGKQAVILGTISRTWYCDQCDMVSYLSFLWEKEANAIVMGPGPFAITTGVAAQAMKVPMPRFIHERDAPAKQLILNADLVLVLQSRTTMDLDATSPLVPVARKANIPMLILFHTEDAAFLGGNDEQAVGVIS